MGTLNPSGLGALAARELRNKYEAAVAERRRAQRSLEWDPMNPIKQQEVERCQRIVEQIESEVRRAAW